MCNFKLNIFLFIFSSEDSHSASTQNSDVYSETVAERNVIRLYMNHVNSPGKRYSAMISQHRFYNPSPNTTAEKV